MKAKLRRSERKIARICESFILGQKTSKPVSISDIAKAVIREIKKKYPMKIHMSEKSKKKQRRALRKIGPALRFILPDLMLRGTILVVNQKPMKIVSRSRHYESCSKSK